MTTYQIQIAPRAWKDIDGLEKETAKKLVVKIEALKFGLAGDVKRLKNFEFGYRLRVGSFRVLFDIEMDTIIVRRVKNRREAY